MTQKYYQRNINEIIPHYLRNEMGYDIYVPDVFYTPISFNKKGCPIWIKVNDDGDCYVFFTAAR